MSLPRTSIIRLSATSAVVALAMAGQAVGQQKLSRDGYESVKTLKDAVEVVKGQLKADGKPEYAALVTEARMRDAFRSGIPSYEARLGNLETRHPGFTKQWQTEIKPLCLKIADKGEWPKGASFWGFYTLSEQGADGKWISYDGLGLRLDVKNTDEPGGFAFPVLDVFYGRFEGPRK
jgi:hypothetical protein